MSSNSSQQGRSIAELLTWGAKCLNNISDSPALDANVLLRFCTGFNEVKLIVDSSTPLDESTTIKYIELINRRSRSEPIAYITGTKEFYSLDFTVNSNVLVPRPETELLVEEVLKVSDSVDGPFRFLDLGTGSGCIAVSVANTLRARGKRCFGYCIDKSRDALEVAKINCRKYGLEELLQFNLSNWYSDVDIQSSFHCIVANPPYIPNEQKLAKDLSYEPAGALYSGDDGLSDLRVILKDFHFYLLSPGTLLCEIGHDQGSAIQSIWQQYGSMGRSFSIIQDFASRQRIIKISL